MTNPKPEQQIINEVFGFDGSIYDIPEKDQKKIEEQNKDKKDD